MVLVNFFIRKKKATTANIAKERLQIIISKHNNQHIATSHYLTKLKSDLVQVVKKYIHNPQDISIHINNHDQNISILQCNVFFYKKNIKIPK